MPANFSANYSLSAYDFPGGDVHVSFPNYVQPISSYGAQAFSSAGFPPGQDFSSGNLSGYGHYPFTIDPSTGTRSASDQLLYEAMRTTSLKMYAMSQVRNIVFDGDNTATGLNITTMGVKPFTLTARKEVIICAGVVSSPTNSMLQFEFYEAKKHQWHSPQLLMVSGVGPRSVLEGLNIPVVSALEGVGQNVWDTTNIGGPIFEVNVPGADPVVTDPALFAAASEQFYYNGTGPLSSEGGDFWGWEKLPSRLRTSFTNETTATFAKFPADWPELEIILSGTGGTLVSSSSTRNLATVGCSMVATTSRGNMTISSANNADPPIINPNWLLSTADQQMAVAAYKRMREIVVGLGNVVIGAELLPGANVTTDADILSYIQTKGLKPIPHGSATCAMGRVNETGTVVDSKARVLGVKKLRVIDSSSFAFTPPGHTQGTTYGHAEKLVQDVIDEYML